MNSLKRIILPLAALLLTALTGCQNTPLTDLVDYHRLKGQRLEEMQPEVTLKFARSANLFEDATNSENDMKGDLKMAEAIHDQNAVESIQRRGRIMVQKGAKVKVLGYANPVGQRKEQPVFYLNDDPWLVQLQDGRRAYMAVPEMAIGVPTIKGSTVTDVRINQDKSSDAPYQFRVLVKGQNGAPDKDEWWTRPNFKYKNAQNIPVYSYPRRHETSKFLPVWDFFANHNIRTVCFPDDAFYLYRPLIKMSTGWSMALQFVLTPILLIILLCIALPKVVLRLIWWIRPLPNVAVKVLASLLSFILLLIACAFLDCGLFGTIFYAVVGFLDYTEFLSMDVNSNRCPHCHHLGLNYKGTKYGKWRFSHSSQDRQEEKSRSYRDYTKGDGTLVHETTHNMGTKRYSTSSKRRDYTDYYECPYCHQAISYDDTEEQSKSSSYWVE